MINPKDIHPLTDFKRNTAKFLARFEKLGRPQILTVDGRPKMVLLTIAAFEKLTNELERSPLNAESTRLKEAADISDFAFKMNEQNIRRKFPSATEEEIQEQMNDCLLYTSPSPRD